MSLILLSVGLLILTFYAKGGESIDILLSSLTENTTKTVVDESVAYLEPAEKIAFLTRELFSRGAVQELEVKERNPRSKFYLGHLDTIMEYFDVDQLEEFQITPRELRDFLGSKIQKYPLVLDLFYNLLANYSQINLLNYGNYEKDKVMVKEMPDGSFSIKYIFHFPEKGIAITCWYHSNKEFYQYNEIDPLYDFANNIQESKIAYDATQRPWFKGAEAEWARSQGTQTSLRASWTPVYVFFSDQLPGISCSIALSQPDDPNSPTQEITGVLSISLEIFQISTRYLSELTIGKHGKAFIFDQKGQMLAYPLEALMLSEGRRRKDSSVLEEQIKEELRTMVKQIPKYDKEDPKKIVGYRFVLTPVQESFIELYRTAFKESKIEPNEKGIYSMSNPLHFLFESSDIPYIGVFSPFPEEVRWKWMVGILIPEDDFLGPVKENVYIISGVTGGILILSLILSFWLASRISKPLALLSKQTEKIREFRMDDEEMVLKTPFEELIQMEQAFGNMKSGLRSFKKFVPAKLVRYLIQSGEEAKLGGENRNLTVYFSDIADFTSISEHLSPEELVQALGEYLSEMSDIILKNDGTVDKYIGDAIMAFWGAPQNVENHAYLACISALQNQKRLAELRYTRWNKEAKPLFESRIGINTGQLIVGNMGSEKRLNYTVIGDTVNLASRLEALNKYYGTSIMCSEGTYQLIHKHIATRKLDLVAVKGKTEAIGIYEIVGVKRLVPEEVQDFIGLYEEALVYYSRGDFQKALKRFQECLNIREDQASEIFLDRCIDYLNKAPDPDWHGVHIFTTK